MQFLRIALLAGLKRPITPDTNVSRNRIIADIAMGLCKKGHQVTIFGTKDSYLPGVKIVPVIDTGLNFYKQTENTFYTEIGFLVHQVSEFIKKQQEFDIVHNHMYPEFLLLLALQSIHIPLVTTIHGQITDELNMAFSDTKQASRLVCISKSARGRLGLSADVIYNGIDVSFYTPVESLKKDCLLFAGRMSKAKDENRKYLDPKGVQNAITLAEKRDERLKIVGNVEEPEFFETLVKPHLSEKIEFVGEVSPEQLLTREQMIELFQGAKALINPINWEEPFGMVMIEAMSCGTPVIAYNRGSVSEIVRDGVTGFVIDPDGEDRPGKGSWIIKKPGIEGLVEAVRRIGEIDRNACRKHVEENFTVEQMVDGYEKVYQKILALQGLALRG